VGRFMSNHTNNNANRKEEILKKSRQSQQDEGIEYAVNKGVELGNYYTTVVGFALVIFSVFAQQTLVMYAIFTLMGANAFGEFLAKYRYFKQKRYMIGVILFGVIFGGIFAFLLVRDIGYFKGDGAKMKDEIILKNRLKVARAEKNLSQATLAEMIGVSRNTISSIETGQFCPTAKLDLILCIALDKKFEDLFFFD